MKFQIGAEAGGYTFDASARQITFTGLSSLSLPNILLITNVTDNVIIYNFADSDKGGSLSGFVLTLDYDTEDMDDSDELQIFVDSTDGFISVVDRENILLQWETDTDFNKGTVGATVEVYGTGDAAIVRMKDQPDSDDDIPYNDSANYTYSDSNKITVDQNNNNKAALKLSAAGDYNWTFDSGTGNYIYDDSLIEFITGGECALIGSPTTPYALWHLNESSGLTAADSSGNSRNGTLTNMETGDWTAGKLNNCLDFDGTNEYVDCGAIAGFERDEAFSVEFWFKTSLARTQFILAKQDDSTKRGWSAYIRQASGNFRLAFFLGNNNTSNYIAVEYPMDVNDNLFHHGCITYDGSSIAAGVNVFVDGDNTGNVVILDALSATIINSATCQIGTRGGSSSFAFDGLIDEVAIYELELSSAQVAARYNTGQGTEKVPGGYSIANPGIYANTGYAFTQALDTFTETSTKPTGTAIKYQVTHEYGDSGWTWYYWNGSAWVPRSEYMYPSSITTTTGTLLTGSDLASVQALDGITYDVQEVTGSPGSVIDVEFTGCGCSSPDYINIWAYYDGGSGHTVNVDLYNFATSTYDTLGQIDDDAGTGIDLFRFAVPATGAEYIDGAGLIRLQIDHISPGNINHVLYIDYIEVEITTPDDWYYTSESNTAAEVHANIGSLATSGTFNFLAFLHSDSGIQTPQLDNIFVAEGTVYSTDDNLYIDTTDNSQLAPTGILAWLVATFTDTIPTGTDIRVMLSNDDRVSWLTWNGSAWAAPASATTRTDGAIPADIETNISSFPAGDGTLDVRLFLYTTDNTTTPDVDNINITGNIAYYTSGSWSSNQYNSTYNSLDWGIVTFSINTPSGTAITVKARAANSTTELDAESYGPALASGADANVTGQYIQFLVDLSSDGTQCPCIDTLNVRYITPVLLIEAP
jgi:hypothetical protein